MQVLPPLCAELRNVVMQPMILPMVLTIAESQVNECVVLILFLNLNSIQYDGKYEMDRMTFLAFVRIKHLDNIQLVSIYCNI
jgi:hypothetical protein